jgi:anion-transporting  ArsA/GET3 family ATPase
LHDRRTTFVVVTTLEASPAHEAEYFIEVLASKKFHLGAVVLNKVLPDYLRDPGASSARLAERIEHDASEVAAALDPLIEDGDVDGQLRRVLTEVAENFLRFQLVAQREAEQEAALGRVPDVVATVPYFDNDIFDLRGLLELGARIWG